MPISNAWSTRCCRCNGTAKCLRCACVRSGAPCSRCLPGDLGFCHSTRPRGRSPPSGPSSSVTTPAPSPHPAAANPSASSSPAPSPPPSSQPASPPLSALPALPTILKSHVPTLQHVPKGTRDGWALAPSSCLRSVERNPDELSQWSCLSILAKCVLISPAAGQRLRWREIMKRVKSRLQRWADGDLVSLWSEALGDARSLARRQSRSSAPTSTSNFRRAWRAVQDGRYSKAIQGLTSDGLASLSPEILHEMRKKHPQAPPPSVPLDPVPSSAILSEPAVLKGVRSFPMPLPLGPPVCALVTFRRLFDAPPQIVLPRPLPPSLASSIY